MAFSPRSESFYGDVAQVKVAARRDATIEESERLRQLAAQVSLPRYFDYAPDISISSRYIDEDVTLLWLFDVCCASLCPHNRHRDSSAERCSFDDPQAGSAIVREPLLDSMFL